MFYKDRIRNNNEDSIWYNKNSANKNNDKDSIKCKKKL